MIPGKTLPKPVGKIWASAYMDSKTEVFEIRTGVAGYPDSFQTLYHKEYALGTSLADFLYVDLNVFDMQLSSIMRNVDDINAGRNVNKSFSALFDTTIYWLNQSALFAPFSAAIERLHLIHEKGEALNTDEMERQMDYFKEIQPRLRILADAYYSADASADMAERYFEHQQKYGAELYPQLTFQAVRFGPVSKGANGFFPYDNLLNALMPSSKQDESRCELIDFMAETMSTTLPEDLVHFTIYQYMIQNLRFRVCKYCKRYFGVTGGSNLEYCDRLIEDSTKTCKENGALRIYEKRKMGDPAIREYKRSYKAHNARIRYGLMSREEFSLWSEKAREKRDECVAGKLSLEEFVEWLDSDRLT